MSNSRNATISDGAKRSQLRQQLTIAWVKKFRPDVYKAVEAEAARQVPYVEGNGMKPPPELPTSLANLR